MRRTRNQKGFTIMELMIVIVIIGILIAIAIPAYNNFRAAAQKRACQSNMRTILSANGLYMAETGNDAASIDLLTPYMNNAATITCPTDNTAEYTIAAGVVTCTANPSHGTMPEATP